MRVIKREEPSDVVSQLLAGSLGAMITTLPSFIVMPIWAIFISRYRVVDRDGGDHNAACALICFFAGLAIWIGAALAIAKGVE